MYFCDRVYLKREKKFTYSFDFTLDSFLLYPIGDDQMIALQVRGGPESYMISSWIQLLKLRPSDVGTYTCIVSNKKGEIRASSTVSVNKVIKNKQCNCI